MKKCSQRLLENAISRKICPKKTVGRHNRDRSPHSCVGLNALKVFELIGILKQRFSTVAPWMAHSSAHRPESLPPPIM